MPSLLEDRPTDVMDGQSPLYTKESSIPRYAQTTSQLAQSFGSLLDSDTIDGFEAVSAAVGGPNKLVATGATGYYPVTSIPPSGTTTGGGAPIAPIISSIIIPSTSIGSYAYLSVATDSSLVLTPTANPTTAITLLSNGIFTYWVTFDATDNVLRAQVSNFSTTTTNISILDTDNNVWSITIDADGSFRTTSLGEI